MINKVMLILVKFSTHCGIYLILQVMRRKDAKFKTLEVGDYQMTLHVIVSDDLACYCIR